ncbi:MAG: glycosyltransferase family 39 protein [Chloroflexota bacterium]
MQETKRTLPIWFPTLAALLLGFMLMVVNLTSVGLWSDEGWTIAASAAPDPAAVVSEWVVPDVHPPLYFVALNGWRAFTGDTIFEMRYFAVLITVLGIAISYQLGRSLFSPAAGLLAATFYALHDLVQVLTQEVRHYPGQMALVALAVWLYWRFYRQPTRGRGIVFALGGAALMYTHYWGAFVVLALGIHTLVTRLLPLIPEPRYRPAERARFVLVFVAIGLLFLPWVPALIHQITLERPGGLPHALENTNWVMRVLLYQLLGVPEVLWLVLMAAGTAGVLTLRPRGWLPTARTLLPALVVIVPPLISIAVNPIYPILSFRALAVIVPAVVLLAAHGLARFRPPERTVIAIFIVVFSLTSRSANPIERPDWPQMAQTISLHSDTTDKVLLENDTDEHTLAYYLDQTGTGIDYAYSEHTRDYTPEAFPAYLDAALDGANGVWVARLGWPGEPGGDIRPDLAARGFVQTAPEWDYGMYNDRPVLLWRLDRVPAPDAAPVVTYGENLRLLRAEAVAHQTDARGASAHADVLTVNLLWSPLREPEQEYTVSVLLFGPQGITNQDSRPLNGASPTSTWAAEGLYFDSHAIPIDNLPPGTYRVGVQVYYFTTPDFSETANLLADDCTDDDACRFVIVDEVTIEG